MYHRVSRPCFWIRQPEAALKVLNYTWQTVYNTVHAREQTCADYAKFCLKLFSVMSFSVHLAQFDLSFWIKFKHLIMLSNNKALKQMNKLCRVNFFLLTLPQYNTVNTTVSLTITVFPCSSLDPVLTKNKDINLLYFIKQHDLRLVFQKCLFLSGTWAS